MADRKRDRGASAVEFALVIPLLFALLMGILAFGYAFHVQSVLSNSARDAVRVMALSNVSEIANPEDAAREAAISSAKPSVNLADAQFEITPTTCEPSAESASETATVTITYPMQLLGGIGDITLTGKGTMRCNG